MAEAPAAVRADWLEHYGQDFNQRKREGMTPLEAAELTIQLPRGSRVGQELGGTRAITAETEALWAQIDTQIAIAWANGGGKGPRPKPRPMPKGKIQERKEKRESDEKFVRKARSHAERFGTPEAIAETRRRLALWGPNWQSKVRAPRGRAPQ